MKQLLLLFTIGLFCLTACRKEDEVGEPQSYDDVIELGGDFPDVTVEERTTSESTQEEERNGETWICTVETKDIRAGSGGSSGFPLFNPNASVIYPGNLLQGRSLGQATPDLIAVERAGGVISTDVVDGNIAPSFEVDRVSKGEVAVAINNIIANSTGVVPANFSFDYYNVQSREEFALRARVNVEKAFGELEAKLSFSNDRDYNRYLINLQQSYYTMSFDVPTSLDRVFDESVSPDDLAKYVGPGNPATYISDVTYGRIYYMLIESTSSLTEMDAAISGSFQGIKTKVEGEVDVSYLNELNELKIKVFAYGGDASSTLLTIGKTDLNDLSQLLAESSNIGSGKPISYVVRSLYDNQIVGVQLATQYDVKNCLPSIDPNAPPYTKHWSGLSATFGGIGAGWSVQDDEMILVNQAGDQYMRSRIGQLEGPFPIDQLIDADYPLDGIGAACNLEGNEHGSETVMAFDLNGTNFVYKIGDRWTDPKTILELNDGAHPFKLVGVSAISFLYKDPFGPSQRAFYNADGDKYTVYTNNPQNFSSVRSLDLYSGPYDHPFPSVGAAIGFTISGSHYTIFFDKLGTSYVIYGDIEGTGRRYFGPFSI